MLGTQLEKLLRLFEENVLLGTDLLFDFGHHALGFFVFGFCCLVGSFQSVLHVLLLAQTGLGSLILLLCSIKALHLFLENMIDFRDEVSLVVKLSCKG